MQIEDIERLIREGLPDATVQVDGDGRHFQALIVSPAFEAKSLLQRQRLVNGILQEHFHSDALHALSMRTLTPEEWAQQSREA